MKREIKDNYDVIIIGAGISGLVSGCYLAKAGFRVLVVEKHNKPGGYCSSFLRKGFVFDSAAHSFGSFRKGGHINKIFKDFNLEKKLIVKRSNPSDIIISPDHKISFSNNIDQTKENFIRYFPEEKSNVNYFFDYILNLKSQDVIKLRNKTFKDVLNSIFNNKILIDMLSLPLLGNGGLPASRMHAFTGVSIYAEYMLDGGYYIEGGIQKLPDALEQYISLNNGTVLLGKHVKQIICNQNKVTGVILDDESTFDSSYIISACDVSQTFKKLIGKKHAGNEMINKLDEMEISLSALVLYIGIAKELTNLPYAGSNVWHLPHYDIDKIYNSIRKGIFNKPEYFILRVAPNNDTILALTNAPYNDTSYWDQNKKSIVDQFIECIKNIIPGIHKGIVYLDAATPATLHRYTLNSKGAAFGWAPSQTQLFEPCLSLKSSLKGMYLTGHWTAQALGIPGAAYLGYNTARLISKNENINI